MKIVWIDPCRKGRYKAIVHFEDNQGRRCMRFLDQKDLDILLDINEFP